jgi:hypothetical protein
MVSYITGPHIWGAEARKYHDRDSVQKVQHKAKAGSGHGMLVMFSVTDP